LSQTFECPNCGAPLVYTGAAGVTLRCPYCSSTVILPESLRPGRSPVPADGFDLPGVTAALQEVSALLSAGKKIEAIKLYRQHFGVGLKESQDAIERIERGEPVQITQGVLRSEDRPPVDLTELESELRQLLQEGRKIEAIKRYREGFGEGLSDSKDAVDAFEDGEPLRVPTGWGQAGNPSDPVADRSLAEVARLAQQGDRQAAIQMYREAFDSSLQEAQAVVERLEQDVESDPQWIVAQVQANLAASRPLPVTQIEKKVRAGSCLFAGLAIFMIASILLPLLVGLVQAGGPLRRTWERINPVSYARLESSFGGEGTGPGLFSDPRAIAAGADGSIYVGDYVDGRIQRFDGAGQFLNQWFTREEPYLGSLVVDRTGRVYAAYRGEIVRFDGESGETLGALPNPGDLYFDYAVLTPDGGLVAVVDGEDLVRMDSRGQVQWMVPEAISGVSGDAELEARLAVDGLGNIYALGIFNSAVFKYSPAGRYLNRWGSDGDQPGQFRAANAIAVDGYGRVLVSDMRGVQVFDGGDGRYLDRFDVPGVVFGMAFDEQNDLYAVSNDRMVYRFRLKPPNPAARQIRPYAASAR